MDKGRKELKQSISGRIAPLAMILAIVLPAICGATGQSPRREPRTPRPAVERRIKPAIPGADRSQPDKVFLEHADMLHYEKTYDEEYEQYQVLTGNVKMRQGDMFMYCDSAYFYEESNSMDAFGNVRMEQGDTLFVYADELNYNGETELAVLYADAGRKVRLINRDVKLETDVFNYDMANEVGYYDVGGVLTDKENRLSSIHGEYHPDTKDAIFDLDVKLRSLRPNDTLYINTDSLRYNTFTNLARLVSPSEIINRDGTIYSSYGIYNTRTGEADLYRRSTVVTNRGNTLTGDTLFYDRTRQYGEAFGNMVLTDSVRQSSLQGDYGFYDEARDSAFVTGRALAKEYSQKDTLYLHGDTITAYLDLADSTHVTNAFHRVRFYRVDIQGICDSLSFTQRDSILYMYRHPVIWNETRQIFGNVIYLHINDSTLDWARLPESGVLAEHIAEDCYNQLSGSDMTAWFNDSTIRRMYVEGNVEVIMFPMESDSTYNKFAQTESSFMDAYFAGNSIERINFWPETNSTVTPLYLAKRNSYYLKTFRWYGDLRPTSPEDVFAVPEGMIELFRSATVESAAAKSRKSGKDRKRGAAAGPLRPEDAPVPTAVPEAEPALQAPSVEKTEEKTEEKIDSKD